MKKIIFAIAALGLLGTAACKKDFDKLRQNPNNVQDATPGSFLAPVLYEVTTTNLNRAHRMGNDLMQYSVHKGDGIEFHRYYVTPVEADYFWDRHYRFAYNIKDMYQRALQFDDKNFQGVALTLKAWVFSQLTDIFGDIPYSEALKGDEDNLTPAYDRQQDIYTDLMKGLDSAAVLFSTSGTLAYGTDLLYSGDVSKWRKFCNSLRLRLYLRLSKRTEMNSAAKINEIVSNPTKYPIFTSNADQACLYFTGSEPYYNPFYNTRDLDFGSGKAASNFILEVLQDRNDPRLPIWFTKSGGDYIGVPSGYARVKNGAVFAMTTSAIQNNLKSSPKLGAIMSYAELQFILAEAAQKGWIAGDAKTFYEAGIKASMDHWGATMPADYLTQASVAYDGQLSTIMMQKYLAQWFVGLESWYEFRRTGLPVLPVNPEALNNGKMPVRLLYPTSTQLLNGTHYQEAVSRMGGDDPNIKCWWEQ